MTKAPMSPTMVTLTICSRLLGCRPTAGRVRMAHLVVVDTAVHPGFRGAAPRPRAGGSMSVRQLCAGGIVHDAAGRVLLIRRGQEPSAGKWSIPGGRCLPGESAATACIREVAEETGVLVE